MFGFTLPLGVKFGLVAALATGVLLFGQFERSRGFDEAKAQCDMASLASKNAALQRDLDAAKHSEIVATSQSAALEDREKVLNQRIEDYAAQDHPATPPTLPSAKGTVCPLSRKLTDSDAKRLQDLFR